MGAIRGVGGGKTFFMSQLQRELCKPEHNHILLVLITLVGKWGYNDFHRYKHMFPMNPEKAFALGIIARIASVSFALPNKKVVARIMKAKKEWIRLFEFDFRGDHLALFLVYLAQKRGVRDIVLMVDEAHRGHAMLTDVYRPNNTVDYTFHLNWAPLRHKILREFGMRGAYVESGVQPSIALGSEAAPYSYSMLFSEVLNATTVTQNLFLSDLDADGSKHAVTPLLANGEKISKDTADSTNSTDVAFQWLCQVAAYYAHSPRALELAQDYLRCRIDRTTKPRSLVVTSTMVQDLIEYVEQQLEAMNPALYNDSAPTLDTLYNMLLKEWVYARPPFYEGIRNSLHVNSLKTWEGFPPSLDTCQMCPHPTLQTLNAALFNNPNIAVSNTVECCLHKICKLYREYVVSYPYASRERTLSDLSTSWLQLLLTLAARRGEQTIFVYDLLKTGSVAFYPCVLPYTKVRKCLNREILLPTSGNVPIYTLQHSFNTTDISQTRTAVFEELNTIRLSADVPCIVLKPAEGDSWEHGLAFLDAENNKSQIILMDTEILENGEGSTPHCDANYALVQKGAAVYKATRNSSGSGLGHALANKNYVYVCRSTTEGESFEKKGANFVTIRAERIKYYYKMLYGPFLLIKGEENKPKPYCDDFLDIRNTDYFKYW